MVARTCRGSRSLLSSLRSTWSKTFEMKGSCRDRALSASAPTGSERAHAPRPVVSSFAHHHYHRSCCGPKTLTDGTSAYSGLQSASRRLGAQFYPVLTASKTNLVQHHLRCQRSHQHAASLSPHGRNDCGMTTRSTLGNKRPLFVNQTALPRLLCTIITVHQAPKSARDS